MNTLILRDGAWLGDTTDGVGLVRDIQVNRGCALAGKDVLLLGAGGAARGVVGPLLAAHPRTLAIANRTLHKAEALASAFAKEGAVASMSFEQFEDAVFDVVIDATSASLTDEETLHLPPVQLRPGALAYELAYGKADTGFRRWAKECGASTYADGLGMLVEQAAESFHLWRGVRPDTAPVLTQLRSL